MSLLKPVTVLAALAIIGISLVSLKASYKAQQEEEAAREQKRANVARRLALEANPTYAPDLPQYVRKIQWVDDTGQRMDFGKGPIEVYEGTTLEFVAVKGIPKNPWPAAKPEWTDKSRGGYKTYGDSVVVMIPSVAGMQGKPYIQSFVVECGKRIAVSAQIKLLRSYSIEIWTDDEQVAPRLRGKVASAEIVTMVTDYLGHPLPRTKVRFEATGGGYVNARKPQDDVVTTDKEGYAKVRVSKTGLGKVIVSALVVGDRLKSRESVTVDFSRPVVKVG